VLRGIELASGILVGRNREHFKAAVETADLEGIAFNRPDLKNLPLKECYCDTLFELQKNEFKGKKSIQLRIKDMKCTYVPDNLNNPHSELRTILKKSIDEIIKKRVVLFIYPTYRSLTKHKTILNHYLRTTVLQELHGRLPLEKRLAAKKEFEQGLSKIFLTTEAFMKYYLKHKKMPENLEYIVEFWPLDSNRKWLKSQNSFYYDTYHGKKKNLSWTNSGFDLDNGKRYIIYTNRLSTIKRISEERSDIIIEAGIRETKTRRELRRRFITSKNSILLWDGEYTGGLNNYTIDKIDEVLFADAPYSIYETRLMFDNISTKDNIFAVALFNPEDIRFNYNYLEKLYPDFKLVKEVLEYFLKLRRNPIRMKTTQIVQAAADFPSRGGKTYDLIPVLNILVDLGLCHVKKKGSIIEITFINTNNMVFDISNSPYYLEGLAEKRAFLRWKEEFNRSLAR